MAHLADSASLALCKQENKLDIVLDTLPSLVFFVISQAWECVTQTLEILQISRDPQTRVSRRVVLQEKIIQQNTVYQWCENQKFWFN